LKYEASGIRIRLPDRKALNQKCLAALKGEETMTPGEIFNSYTGIGDLHGLKYVDYGNYHDFSEAKKEIEQGQFFTPDALCAWVVDCIRPDGRQKIAEIITPRLIQFKKRSDLRFWGCAFSKMGVQVV
jgi:type I restriction-modification system DNA methylase subunit